MLYEAFYLLPPEREMPFMTMPLDSSEGAGGCRVDWSCSRWWHERILIALVKDLSGGKVFFRFIFVLFRLAGVRI